MASLLEKEFVDIFMGTLQGVYFEKMVGSVLSGFSDIVTIGERIEAGVKSGKIQRAVSNTPYNLKHMLLTSQKRRKEKSML